MPSVKKEKILEPKEVEKEVEKEVKKEVKPKEVKPKEVKPKKEKKKKEKKEKEEVDDDKRRTFKCYYNNNKILTDEINNDELFGRFKGKRPRQAANKAFSSICKKLIEGGKNIYGKEIIFSIIECTRGAKNRRFNYIGTKEKLDKVSEREVQSAGGDGTRKIIYKTKNNIRKYIIDNKE